MYGLCLARGRNGAQHWLWKRRAAGTTSDFHDRVLLEVLLVRRARVSVG
jgi:hypothetical protein